jgi:hypothetical protein
MTDTFYNTSAGKKFITTFLPITRTATTSNYATLNITTNGSSNVTFVIPYNFLSLTSIGLVLSPAAGAAGTGKNIDLASSYAQLGQNINTFSFSDTTSTYDLGSVNVFTELPVTPLFPSVSANTICGLTITHNAVGGTVSYYNIKLVYLGSTI